MHFSQTAFLHKLSDAIAPMHGWHITFTDTYRGTELFSTHWYFLPAEYQWLVILMSLTTRLAVPVTRTVTH